MGDPWEDLLAFAPEGEVDDYARKQLKMALKEYSSRSGQELARVSFLLNNMPYLQFPTAVMEVDEPHSCQINFYKPDLKKNWDFNLPVKSIQLAPKGMGMMKYFNYDPFALNKWGDFQYARKKKVMLRVFMEHFFVPESIKTASRTLGEEKERKYIPRLRLLEEFWSDVKSGIIPFQVRLCLYTKEARYSFSVNLVRGTLLQDFRAGKVSPRSLIRRSPMEYLLFDEVFASIDLPPLPRKVMRMAFETETISASDISLVFDVSSAISQNNLKSLETRGILKMVGQPPSQVFEIDMEGLEKLAREIRREFEGAGIK